MATTPSKTALAAHPLAVVALSAMADDPAEGTAYDFEWFDNPEAYEAWAKTIREWADEDVAERGDMYHLIANVTDTKFPFALGEITVHCKKGKESEAYCTQWAQRLVEDNTLILPPAPVRVNAATKKTAKGKAKINAEVKPIRSAAAAVASKPEDTGAPTERRGPRVRKAAQPETPAPAPTPASLKRRLAKKAEATTVPADEVPEAEVETPPTPKPPAKRAIRKPAAAKAAEPEPVKETVDA